MSKGSIIYLNTCRAIMRQCKLEGACIYFRNNCYNFVCDIIEHIQMILRIFPKYGMIYQSLIGSLYKK